MKLVHRLEKIVPSDRLNNALLVSGIVIDERQTYESCWLDNYEIFRIYLQQSFDPEQMAQNSYSA